MIKQPIACLWNGLHLLRAGVVMQVVMQGSCCPSQRQKHPDQAFFQELLGGIIRTGLDRHL